MAITHDEITIAGKKRSLLFSINALTEAMQEIGSALEEAPTLVAVRALVWSGIRAGEHRPGFSIVAAGDLIQAHIDSGGDFMELAISVYAAMGRALAGPPKPEGPEGNVQSPAAGG